MGEPRARTMDEGLSRQLSDIARLAAYARGMMARVEGIADRGQSDESYIARQHRYRCIVGYIETVQAAAEMMLQAMVEYRDGNQRYR